MCLTSVIIQMSLQAVVCVCKIREEIFSFSSCCFTASKWKVKPEPVQYQCQNGAMVAHDEAHSADCLQIRSEERAAEKASQEVRSAEPSRRPPPPSSSKNVVAESKDQLHSGEGGPESSITPENLPQEDQGSKANRAAKSASPKARRSNTNTPSPPAGRPEKKQRTNSKTISPNRDAADKSATAIQNYHTEQISKYVAVYLHQIGPKLVLRCFCFLSDLKQSCGG